jgi:hypothetical protein
MLLPHPALGLLESRAPSSGRAGRKYHEPKNGKKRNFLTQFGSKMGDSLIGPPSNLSSGIIHGGRSRLHGLKICESIHDNPAQSNEPGWREKDIVILTHGGVDAFGEKPP